MADDEFPIGIDLGTTFSSLAYVDEDNRIDALRLPNGRFAIASAVYFKNEREVIVGDEALEFSIIDESRLAQQFKRNMGQSDFSFEADGRRYRPEELSAMVLRKLIGLAEKKLGPIEKAVISVPYVFDEVRRQGTKDAARLAGIKEVDLVDEPVAAALAYGHTLFQGGGLFNDQLLDSVFDDAFVLVYDLGGGTFDATIMKLGKDGKFEVIATDGDERLGGVDWDEALMSVLLKKLSSSVREECRRHPEFMQELRMKIVEAKETLSERGQAEVRFTYGGENYAIVVTRSEFEQESRPLVTRTHSTLTNMFHKTRLSWSHVDHVLIVGGSSRMPMIRKQLMLVSDREHLDMSLSPDTAIAKGAALYAAFRSRHHQMRLKEVVTVNSHPLGLRVNDPKDGKDINDVILEANTPTLTRVKRRYVFKDREKPKLLEILLGDFVDPNACVKLGQTTIKAPGTTQTKKQSVYVTFCFQQNGLLLVEAIVERPGKREPLKKEIEVIVEGRMTDEQFDAAATSLRGINID